MNRISFNGFKPCMQDKSLKKKKNTVNNTWFQSNTVCRKYMNKVQLFSICTVTWFYLLSHLSGIWINANIFYFNFNGFLLYSANKFSVVKLYFMIVCLFPLPPNVCLIFVFVFVVLYENIDVNSLIYDCADDYCFKAFTISTTKWLFWLFIATAKIILPSLYSL